MVLPCSCSCCSERPEHCLVEEEGGSGLRVNTICRHCHSAKTVVRDHSSPTDEASLSDEVSLR